MVAPFVPRSTMPVPVRPSDGGQCGKALESHIEDPGTLARAPCPGKQHVPRGLRVEYSVERAREGEEDVEMVCSCCPPLPGTPLGPPSPRPAPPQKTEHLLPAAPFVLPDEATGLAFSLLASSAPRRLPARPPPSSLQPRPGEMIALRRVTSDLSPGAPPNGRTGHRLSVALDATACKLVRSGGWPKARVRRQPVPDESDEAAGWDGTGRDRMGWNAVDCIPRPRRAVLGWCSQWEPMCVGMLQVAIPSRR
ncbi:hypothetical protein GQ53DRAFT_547629 [Thozetella sp. PMI_491]|nr:hypothetical protein GQ53DRAFT_547629 [Thozetella sp. PMI_491]